jgi:hypothetical protein
MGKRSEFERRKNDLYETFDPRAVAALLPHLMPQTRFVEPCAGAGRLVEQLIAAGHICVGASDIEPLAEGIRKIDAMKIKAEGIDAFITNPPWTRALLHPLIVHLSDQAPTWLLFDADWKHTKQAAPLLPRLRRVVSIGRLKWIEGSKMDGKDNCCWYLFTRPGNALPDFVGRAA